jgi:hypothetical protein
MQSDQIFSVNLDAVLVHNLTPSYLKVAILKARANGYYTLNEFLTDISVDELQSIQLIFDKVLVGDDNATRDAILLVATLAHTEGVLVESDKCITDFLKTMTIAINLESLYRKGFIELDRTYLNFLESDKVVMKSTQAGIDYIRNIKGESDV